MLNKMLVIGNVGRDPEMRYTPNGSAVTSFSLAVNRGITHRPNGEPSGRDGVVQCCLHGTVSQRPATTMSQRA